MRIRTAAFCASGIILGLGVLACNVPLIGSIAPAATGTPESPAGNEHGPVYGTLADRYAHPDLHANADRLANAWSGGGQGYSR